MSRRLCRLKTAVLPQAPGPTPQHPLLRSYSTSCVATTSFSPQLQNDIEDAFEETTVEAMVDIGEEEEIETADAMVTVNEEEDARDDDCIEDVNPITVAPSDVAPHRTLQAEPTLILPVSPLRVGSTKPLNTFSSLEIFDHPHTTLRSDSTQTFEVFYGTSSIGTVAEKDMEH